MKYLVEYLCVPCLSSYPRVAYDSSMVICHH